jgi:hypothetical protein
MYGPQCGIHQSYLQTCVAQIQSNVFQLCYSFMPRKHKNHLRSICTKNNFRGKSLIYDFIKLIQKAYFTYNLTTTTRVFKSQHCKKTLMCMFEFQTYDADWFIKT